MLRPEVTGEDAATRNVTGDHMVADGGVRPNAIQIVVDGVPVPAREGATILDACDEAGLYIPRLCAYPGLECCTGSGLGGTECGLCVVEVVRESGPGPARPEGAQGDVPTDASRPESMLACRTRVAAGMRIRTAGDDLVGARRERLAAVVRGHPLVCLTCPDRDGCARTSCTFGHPSEARCCDELGHCELGKLILYLDAQAGSTCLGGGSEASVSEGISREATLEGRIRREPGLCVGCGRCVVVCWHTQQGGHALGLGPDGRVRPSRGTLRASGCTFCGHCVIVCPTGALTAPGEAGAAWLVGRRERSGLATRVLPPEPWLRIEPGVLALVPEEPGVFRLLDQRGTVLIIAGVADLRRGLRLALEEPSASTAAFFTVQPDPLYTQRESELLTAYAQEHGHLPAGNDMGDELFDDDLDD